MITRRILFSSLGLQKNNLSSFGQRLIRTAGSRKNDSNSVKEKISLIKFDSEGKALIFEHGGGLQYLKWVVRGVSAVTILSGFLFVSELVDPSRLLSKSVRRLQPIRFWDRFFYRYDTAYCSQYILQESHSQDAHLSVRRESHL